MGRKTFDSNGRRAFPKRKNIVISRGTLEESGVIQARSIDEALDKACATGCEECFVIGGSYIYALALPLANRLYQTIVHVELEGDTFFPEFDMANWNLLSSKHHASDSQHLYAFDMQILERDTRL